MLLTWLSIAVAAAVVLLVAGFLVAIGWKLSKARRNVVDLAHTLEEIAEGTEPLSENIEPVDAGLSGLAEEVAAAEEALSSALDAVEGDRRRTTGA